MLLATPQDASELPSIHPFLYGHILGIFHVNTIYKGPTMDDYNPRQFYFLWIRWYDLDLPTQKGKSTSPYQLEWLTFPSMFDEHAFGFVDPADVIRGCHIVPAFAKGKKFPNGKGMFK